MALRELLLEKFDRIHELEASHQIFEGSRVPKEFVEVLGDGIERIISPLKFGQPLTHAALMSSERVVILESKFNGRKNLFFLGFCYRHHVIIGSPFNRRSLEYRYKDKLKNLSSDLYGYYKYFDGLDNPLDKMPGIDPFDLPKSLSAWTSLDRIRAGFGIPTEDLFRIERDFDPSSLRVWIHNRDGRLFIVDMSSEGGIYLMNLNDPNQYSRLEDPVSFLDRYCSEVVIGS